MFFERGVIYFGDCWCKLISIFFLDLIENGSLLEFGVEINVFRNFYIVCILIVGI